MNVHTLTSDMATLLTTLGCLLKTQEDHFAMSAERLLQISEGKRYDGVAVKQAAPAATA
jgi:hypothetical protein